MINSFDDLPIVNADFPVMYVHICHYYCRYAFVCVCAIYKYTYVYINIHIYIYVPGSGTPPPPYGCGPVGSIGSIVSLV